jgi:hypothetical protein
MPQSTGCLACLAATHQPPARCASKTRPTESLSLTCQCTREKVTRQTARIARQARRCLPQGQVRSLSLAARDHKSNVAGHAVVQTCANPPIVHALSRTRTWSILTLLQPSVISQRVNATTLNALRRPNRRFAPHMSSHFTPADIHLQSPQLWFTLFTLFTR